MAAESPETKKKLLHQHLKHILATQVKLNEAEAQQNNKILNDCLDRIIREMCAADCLFDVLYERIYYTGSYYEGLRVKQADEFDLNIVLKFPFQKGQFEIIAGGQNIPYSFCLYKIKNKPEHFLVSDKQWPKLRSITRFFNSDGYLNPDEIRRWLQSLTDKALGSIGRIPNVERIVPSQSGPAKTIYIITKDRKQIDVDLVPVIEMQWPVWPQGARTRPSDKVPAAKRIWFLVPKPYKGTQNYSNRQLLWRLHFPEVEKNLMNDKSCAKPLIKLLKLLRDCEQWHTLASYYLKTIVLWEIEKHPDKDYWNEKNMSTRFLELLQKLQEYIKSGTLPYFFYNSYSLIEGMPQAERVKIENRINRILHHVNNDPASIMGFFKTR